MTSACVLTRHTDTVVGVSSDESILRNTVDKIEIMCSTRYGFITKLWGFFSDIFAAGILNDDGTLNNDASCQRLAEVALAYARAGKSSLTGMKFVSIGAIQ